MNYVMTKICYSMLKIIQKKSIEVPKNKYGERIREKKDFYGKITTQIEKDVLSKE